MSLLEQLFPRLCLGCGRALGAGPRPLLLCVACRGQLVAFDRRRACRACLRPLPGAARAAAPLCLGCRTRVSACAPIVPVWTYQPPLDGVIRALKFRRLEFLASGLVAEALARESIAALEPLDLVVPVPMPLLRRLARGFNPAASLARALARSLAIPSAGLLRRPLWERRQTGLGRRERASNPRAALRGRGPPAPALSGARVLLVDDVVTTGATVNRCAAALRQAGVASVAAFVLAATPTADPAPGAGSPAVRRAGWCP